MSVPTDNLTDLIDRLYDARTLGIDTVEWLDQYYKSTDYCACVGVILVLIGQAIAETQKVIDHLGPIP